jgi:cytidylate kinase
VPSETDRQPSASPPRAIAIDGPVASGKSAVGGIVARKLGYRFVDTGMMYRAVTWQALERGIDASEQAALVKLAEDVNIEISGDRILADGADVTDRLRSQRVGEAVSLVSRVPGVRKAMVERQRELAAEGSIVMAGRDIGTVVLPDAPLKVYLDASPDERVRRRHAELVGSASAEQVREELALRDAIDTEREASPLRPADDAVIIDTGHLSLEQVVDRILELASC